MSAESEKFGRPFQALSEKEREELRERAESRISQLIGQEISGAVVDDMGYVTITMKNGSKLEIRSYDAFDDAPDFEGIKIDSHY